MSKVIEALAESAATAVLDAAVADKPRQLDLTLDLPATDAADAARGRSSVARAAAAAREAELRKQIDQLRLLLADSETRARTLEAHLNAEPETEALTASASASKRKAREGAETAALTAKLTEMEARMKAAQEDLAATARALEVEKTARAELDAQFKALMAEKGIAGDAEVALKEADAKRQEAETQLQAARKETAAARKTLETERRHHKEAKERVAMLETRVTELERAPTVAPATVEAAPAADVAAQETRQRALEEELAQARQQATALRTEADEWKTRADTLGRERGAADEAVEAVRAQAARELEHLRAQQRTREEQIRKEVTDSSAERERRLSQQLGAARNLERQLMEQASQRQRGRALAWTSAALALAVAGVTGFWLGRSMGAGGEPEAIATEAPPAAVSVKPATPVAAKPAPLPSAAASAGAAKPVAPSMASPPSPAWPALAVPGVRAQTSGREMTMIFEYGVFARNVEMSGQAQQDLRALAAQLKPRLAGFRLEIEGHTDSDPVNVSGGKVTDNRALGLKRATVVRDFLVKQGLPAAALAVSTAGEANPPYPNATPESRRKNRTVVLKLVMSP